MPSTPPLSIPSLIVALRETLLSAAATSKELFKIMVPVLIGVKILQETGLVEYAAWPLRPLMAIVGLPPEMGLAWATALLNNMYGGAAVFFALLGEHPMTQAQATVLCTMMLVAHTLPVELAIARKSGPKLPFQLLTRFFGALTLGWLLHTCYDTFGLLQNPVTPLAMPHPGDQSIRLWATGLAQTLLSIFCIIFALLVVMRILQRIGVLRVINTLLRPALRFMGIGDTASAITIVGLTLGISYGGGLIINEARAGTTTPRDIFFSLTFMGLCHSLIEDTLLMVVVGGHFSGIFWARLAFALGAMTILVRVTALLPAAFCERHLWGRPA